MQLRVDPITNPASIITAQPFTITLSSESFSYSMGVTTVSAECLSFLMPSSFYSVNVSPTPALGIVNQVTVVPANSDTLAWFGLTFSFNANLQPNTLIKIKVSQYMVLINSRITIECYARAGLQLFSSCSIEPTLTVSYIVFTLLEPYQRNTLVDFDMIGYSMFRFEPLPSLEATGSTSATSRFRLGSTLP